MPDYFHELDQAAYEMHRVCIDIVGLTAPFNGELVSYFEHGCAYDGVPVADKESASHILRDYCAQEGLVLYSLSDGVKIDWNRYCGIDGERIKMGRPAFLIASDICHELD